MRSAYEKLCVDERLKDEHMNIVKKKFTHALNFTMLFKVEWFKIFLI